MEHNDAFPLFTYLTLILMKTQMLYLHLNIHHFILGLLNEALMDCLSLQDSDGEKSDDNLVVDVSNEVSSSARLHFIKALLFFFFFS